MRPKKLLAEAGEADFEHDDHGQDELEEYGDAVAAQLREAGIKVERTAPPGSTFWNDWTKYPYSLTIWYMRPLGVQDAGAGLPHRRSLERNPAIPIRLSTPS